MNEANQQRFTAEARQVLLYAHEEAVRLHHQELGTKHILIGLIRVQESAAGKLLYRLGLDLELTRTMEGRLAHVAERPDPVKPELGPAAKALLEQAVTIAAQADQSFISTGHLLLGLVAVEDSVAVKTLDHFGITPPQIRAYRGELLLGED